MNKKKGGRKKTSKSVDAQTQPDSNVDVVSLTPDLVSQKVDEKKFSRKSLLPKDLYKEIELLKNRVAELEKKLS